MQHPRESESLEAELRRLSVVSKDEAACVRKWLRSINISTDRAKRFAKRIQKPGFRIKYGHVSEFTMAANHAAMREAFEMSEEQVWSLLAVPAVDLAIVTVTLSDNAVRARAALCPAHVQM